ncbi:hypothetical protein [Levilactobacillus cerevisiae]|uniref:hypothetical protein n=1 Tax=Levilactobacillus cerevisiae TaxID=1704076 RepID=UPI0013DE0757|nr:hypothetical protein [Levilactobacillus cerevisiae]
MNSSDNQCASFSLNEGKAGFFARQFIEKVIVYPATISASWVSIADYLSLRGSVKQQPGYGLSGPLGVPNANAELPAFTFVKGHHRVGPLPKKYKKTTILISELGMLLPET